MPQHDLKKASRVEWYAQVVKEGDYPGDTNVMIGCLQRIADATEAMAKNYIRLQDDNEWLKKSRDRWQKDYEHMKKSNAALRGWIKKLKNT